MHWNKYIKFRLIGLCYHILKGTPRNNSFYKDDNNDFINYMVTNEMDKKQFIKSFIKHKK